MYSPSALSEDGKVIGQGEGELLGRRGEITYWERVNKFRWGQYLSAIESRFIANASTLAGPPRQAIEVGADSGRWSKMLADKGWKMTCTDVNGAALALCEQRVANATTILVNEADETLPAETDSMQLLLCIEVPYVSERDWFMHEAARVVAEGGHYVGVMHNRRSARGIAHNVLARGKTRSGYRFYRKSYTKWRQQIRDYGFEIVAEEGFCWLPMRRDSNSPLIPLLTGIEKWFGLRRLVSLSPWVLFIARKSG